METGENASSFVGTLRQEGWMAGGCVAADGSIPYCNPSSREARGKAGFLGRGNFDISYGNE